MRELIQAFPAHLAESVEIYKKTTYSEPKQAIRNVLISGLGGSGIGGTIVSDLARMHAPVPVLVNKDYHIPAFAGPDTLFIASSYSGGTEETLEAVERAHEKGCKIICITSGGRLAELAAERGYDVAIIPGGAPPRAAFGLSFAQLTCIFAHYGLLPKETLQELAEAITWIQSISSRLEKETTALAQHLSGKLPVLYVDSSMEGVAIRFRQQLNENSKMLAWHGVVPEMNHNELVGWTEPNEKIAVIYLKNATDYFRNAKRMDINSEIIRKYTSHIYEIRSEGRNFLEQVIYLIHYCDWVSFHLAEIRNVDIMEIQVIDYLKSELSKL